MSNELQVGWGLWDGVTYPPVGATIVYKGGTKWDLDMGSFQGVFTSKAAADFVTQRQQYFDYGGGIFVDTKATWDGGCFRLATDGRCLDVVPTLAPGLAPALTVPHWEHQAGGWVWVGPGAPTSPPPAGASWPGFPSAHPAASGTAKVVAKVKDAVAPKPPPPIDSSGQWERHDGGWVWVETSPSPSPPPPIDASGHWEHHPQGWVWTKDTTMSAAQTDVQNGYTHYLCYIDEFGKEGGCSTMTSAQTKLAVDTVFATPVGAEDRVAGVIKPIDPSGKYGPRTVNPAPMLSTGSLTMHLLQWQAVQQALASNPAAAVTENDLASAASSPETPTPIEKKTHHVVRILEGVAAVAATLFVGFEIWKHVGRKRA